MVKHCSSLQRKNYDAMRQQIVDYFCPKYSVPVVEASLSRIRMKAYEGSAVRSFAREEVGFKCKCGHTEAWEYPTHSTCKKCALVQDKIHQGKAYRDIRERADLNGVGMEHDTMMSQGYNVSTVPKQNADPRKRAPDAVLNRLARTKVRTNKVAWESTKDKHILRAKREFEEMSARLHFNSTPNAALQLFARFLSTVGKLDDENVVHAACMFHTLKKPTGKTWTKKFRKGVYNTSKKKRLKMMVYK